MAPPPPPPSLSPSDRLLRVAGAVSILVVLFYLGRPIYWAIEDQLVELREPHTSPSLDVAEAEAAEGARRLAPLDPLAAGATSAESKPDPSVEAAAAVEGTEEHKEALEGSAEAAAAENVGEVEGPKEGEQEAKEGEQVPQPDQAGQAAVALDPVKGVEVLPGATSSRPDPAATDPGSFARGVRPIIHEGKPMLDVLKRPIWERPPEGTPMPDKEEFKLRREMVETRQKDNVIVVTFANHAFMDFVTNLVMHLTNMGVHNILIGAMDQKILEGLFYAGVPVFDLESGMPEADAGWGTPIFHKMGREKVTLVNVFLAMGYELFICDTDVVFMRNPLPFVARFPEADILTSSDNVVRTVDDESLEHWDRAWAAYNIGILHFRPTEPAKRFAREWAELLDGDSKIWDQNGFNDLLRKKLGPDVPGLNNNIFWAYDGTLKLGILPVSIFCSGHTYFVQRLYEAVGLQPYAFHATFQFAGTEGKRHRFREAKEFFDPPEYYDPDNGLLSYVNKIPEDLLTGGEHSVVSHFNLVNYQLKNLRQALAIATIINRTLVLPEMWCRFERMWYPHNGILDDTVTKQPFLCPFDQIIELGRMFPGKLSDAEFGPAVGFREYSFLDNPRTPDIVKQSKVQVILCDRGTDRCSPGAEAPSSNPGSNAIYLPRQATESEVRDALKPEASVKLVEFSSMVDAFGGWDNQNKAHRFNQRLQHYVGIWCCVQATPGHIHYDFFASEKPGWLPKPPTGWQDDHPSWETPV